jgi:hypothetical protein
MNKVTLAAALTLIRKGGLRSSLTETLPGSLLATHAGAWTVTNWGTAGVNPAYMRPGEFTQ